MRRGLEGIERFMVEDRDDAPGRRPPGQPAPGGVPVARVGHGSRDGRAERRGLPADHPAIVRAADWLLGEEVTLAGDWSVARPASRPAAGRSSSRTTTTPTSTTPPRSCSRLRDASRAPPLPGVAPDARQRALEWVEGMQSSDGGWGAFDADNTRALVRELPFLDFGEVIDEPSADVTAHAVEMLAAARSRRQRGRAAWRALADRAPGGRRLVVRALGRQPRLRHRRRGARPDRRRGRAPRASASGARSAGWRRTRTKTAAGARTRAPTTTPRGSGAARAPPRRRPGRCSRCTPPASARGRSRAASHWLVATQRADGGWDEPQYTGTGFPSDYYINYHLYRLTFPIMALGRCLAAPPSGAAAAEPASDRGDAHRPSRRSIAARLRRGGDGARAERELPRREPRRCRGRAQAPAGDLRLRAARRRARATALRGRPARALGLARGRARPRLRGAGEPPADGAPAVDDARVRAAARAVRAPDRGQPRRSARPPLRDLGAAARLLRAVGRPGRRARAGRASGWPAPSGSRSPTGSARRCS